MRFGFKLLLLILICSASLYTYRAELLDLTVNAEHEQPAVLENQSISASDSYAVAPPQVIHEKATNPGLTKFAKTARDYIEEMQLRSDLQIPTKQKNLLKEAVRHNSFERLEAAPRKAHKRLFTQAKKNELIREWEKETEQKWPVYQETLYSTNGRVFKKPGYKYDAHHIIPKSHGGPHLWWNMHPLSFENHQKGVHLPGSPLAKLQRRDDLND